MSERKGKVVRNAHGRPDRGRMLKGTEKKKRKEKRKRIQGFVRKKNRER